MDCKDVRESLVDYVLYDLNLGQIEEIGKHLARCAECSAEEGCIRKTLEVMGGLVDREPSLRTYEALRWQVTRPRRRAGVSKVLRRIWRPVPVFATLAGVLLMASVFLLNMWPETKGDIPPPGERADSVQHSSRDTATTLLKPMMLDSAARFLQSPPVKARF
ncbi:MAG: hypothetical protein ACE5OR_04600 [bacterium]